MKHLPSTPSSAAHLAGAHELDSRRRRLVGAAVAGGALAAVGAPALVRAQAGPKIRIGYWPVAAGLPFFAAIEKGYFKEAGLEVEPLKFAGAQQVMEAMLSGRSDGSSNGTGSANLAIGEIAQPGPVQDLRHQPEQRQVRARRVHRRPRTARSRRWPS